MQALKTNADNMVCQVLKAAQGKVFEGSCIFAGVCAPQAFVYTPGMYSSSNQDFVRGTVLSFYEMFKQVASRRSGESSSNEEEDEFRAFAFTNETRDDEMVCPLDNMEWELKVRNQAMKKGCASVHMDSLKQGLLMFRVVVDVVVKVMYILLQIAMCLFRLLISIAGGMNEVAMELEFWFNELVIIMVDAMKRLADMLFNMIFSIGPLGSVMKTVLQAICWLIDKLIWVWNWSSEYVFSHSHAFQACFRHKP